MSEQPPQRDLSLVALYEALQTAAECVAAKAPPSSLNLLANRTAALPDKDGFAATSAAVSKDPWATAISELYCMSGLALYASGIGIRPLLSDNSAFAQALQEHFKRRQASFDLPFQPSPASAQTADGATPERATQSVPEQPEQASPARPGKRVVSDCDPLGQPSGTEGGEA